MLKSLIDQFNQKPLPTSKELDLEFENVKLLYEANSKDEHQTLEIVIPEITKLSNPLQITTLYVVHHLQEPEKYIINYYYHRI